MKVLSREERIKQFGGVYTVSSERQHFEEPKALIEDLIPQKEFTLLTGPPKVGKSTFGAHLAHSVATGNPFFNRQVLKQGKVVYVALERADQTEARLRKLVSLHNHLENKGIHIVVPDEIEELQYLFFNNPKNLRDDVQIIINHLTKKGITDVALFIIDSLENCLNGSDSQQSDAGPWCSGLKRLIDYYQSSALVLHHDTKGSEDDSGSRTAYSGSRVFLARSGGWIRATHKGDGIKLRTVTGNYGHDWTQEVKIEDSLYAELSPTTNEEELTQSQFVEALVRESIDDSNTTIFQHEILTKALTDNRKKWPTFGQPQLSREWKKLVESNILEVVEDTSADGRSLGYKQGSSF